MSKNWYWNIECDNKIICPYCGEKYEPTVEDTYIGGEPVECYEDEKEQEFTCDCCGKKFAMTPSLSWDYKTATIDGEMTEKEYEEKEWYKSRK